VSQPPQVLIFDVNETLLDLSAMEPSFVEIFGSAEPVGEWFARLLHGSLVANHTNSYRSFGLIATEALKTLAARKGIEISLNGAAEVVANLRRLPPHPDVPGALEGLRASGFRLVTLTNGSADAIAEQLQHSGLAGYFERSLSVDAVRRFKPAPEVYRHAASELEIEMDEGMMVAAHDWDILGARSAGMPGAFIKRTGVVWSLPDPLPDLVAPDIRVLAELLTSL
jgi:2-haloacid dehalogenase